MFSGLPTNYYYDPWTVDPTVGWESFIEEKSIGDGESSGVSVRSTFGR
jgi:hypothetical protein